MRLNFAQAVQAIGTVVGPVLASHVFFKNVNDHSLSSVQWVYLGIAIFVFLLAGVFYISTIPEITDADMERQMQLTGGVFTETENKPLSKQYHLYYAAFSQFCYVGSQVAVAGYFVNYVTETRPHTSSATGANFLAVAQGCFAIGRFLGTFFMKFFKPRLVFFAFFTGVIIFQAVAVGARGNGGLASLMLVLFFESICFPTIFTLGIRGLGKHTKFGSTVIIAAIIGGAVVPPLLGATADAFNNTGPAMFVPLIFFVIAYAFPVAVNFHSPTTRIMDGFLESRVGATKGLDDEVALEARGKEATESL
jgi:FHS family L-fucose permease-like MFS transporter